MTTVLIPHQKVALAQVSFAKNTMTRADTNEDAVKACAEKWKDAGTGNPFESDPEPIHLFQDHDGVLHIGDGRTRLLGADKAGRQFVTAIIEDGTLTDAIEYGLACNHKNGTSLTRRDQTMRVKLAHSLHPAWSDNKIATLLDVARSWVAEVRARLTPTDEKRAEKLRDEAKAAAKKAKDAEKGEPAAVDQSQEELRKVVRERQRKAKKKAKPAERVSDSAEVNGEHGKRVAETLDNIKSTDETIKGLFSGLVKALDVRRELTAENDNTPQHHDAVKAALNTAFLGWEAWKKAT